MAAEVDRAAHGAAHGSDLDARLDLQPQSAVFLRGPFTPYLPGDGL